MTADCSGASSGKTALANVLTEFVPNNERIILIGEAAEIQIQKPNVLRFEARREQSGKCFFARRLWARSTQLLMNAPIGNADYYLGLLERLASETTANSCVKCRALTTRPIPDI